MATYKVIQDVEAEDKLLGPLTLRQFIYALISAVCLYLTYFVAVHNAAFMAAILLPIAAIFGFFAFPWGRDQPTELWALAKIRYLIKPRKRIWDQAGIKELVSITAPKHVSVNYTNGLTPTEVDSRLRALAQTIDSRGWAIKNSNINMATRNALNLADPQSDRLITPMSLPQQVDEVGITAADDILDEQNNTTAQHLDSMISASSQAHRQKIVNELKQPAPVLPPPPEVSSASGPKTPSAKPMSPNDYWFMNQPARAVGIPSDMVTFNTQVITPGTPEAETPDAPPVVENEAEIVNELEAHKHTSPNTAYYSHLHTIRPLSEQEAAEQQQREQADAAAQATGGAALSAPGGAAMPVPDNRVPLPPIMPPVPTMPLSSPVQQAYSGIPAMQPMQPQSPPPAMQMPMGPVTPWVPPNMPPTANGAPPQMTPASQTAILQLSRNDDLNVATIAREANRNAEQNEVVIKLH